MGRRDQGEAPEQVVRIRVRVRTLMMAVALLATLLGVATGIERRRETFKRLAGYHFGAHCVLSDRLGPLLLCGIRTESENEEIYCEMGVEECLAYKATMYHYKLSQKYALAAKHPWLPISADPPPPPGANPQFEMEPLYFQLANDEKIPGSLK